MIEEPGYAVEEPVASRTGRIRSRAVLLGPPADLRCRSVLLLRLLGDERSRAAVVRPAIKPKTADALYISLLPDELYV